MVAAAKNMLKVLARLIMIEDPVRKVSEPRMMYPTLAGLTAGGVIRVVSPRKMPNEHLMRRRLGLGLPRNIR